MHASCFLLYLPDVVMALLETEARETQRRLSAPSVLLRQVHAELMQNVSRAGMGEGGVTGAREGGWEGES